MFVGGSMKRVADRYDLGDVLGVGRTGVVYIASERRVEGTVAIKMARPELAADPALHQRFREELAIGQRLGHDNVVRTFSGGVAGGVPYLVLEHVTGCSLTYLRGEVGPIDRDPAIKLILDVLAGLEAMQRAGIAHNDVTSDNVLVAMERDGSSRVKLIDLGSATLVEGRADAWAADLQGVAKMLHDLVAGCDYAAEFDSIAARTFAGELRSFATVAAALRDIAPGAASCGDAMISPDAPTSEFLIDEPSFKRDSAVIAARREALAVRIGNGEVAPVVEAILHLVSALVDEHRIGAAIETLREGIAMLQRGNDIARVQGLWRLELSVAALHGGHGDRTMAVKYAHAARDHARRCESAAGVERSTRLIERISRAKRRAS